MSATRTYTITRLTLLDLYTGNIRIYKDKYPVGYQWTDGNWSCDCNRDSPFHDIDDADYGIEWSEMTLANAGVCDGCQRFIVLDVDPVPEDWNKRGFIVQCNDEYPAIGIHIALRWPDITQEEIQKLCGDVRKALPNYRPKVTE